MRLQLILGVLGAPFRDIYRWEGGRSSQRRRPSRRNPTWGPSQAAPPFFLIWSAGKGRGGWRPSLSFLPWEGKAGGASPPMFPSLGMSKQVEGRTSPLVGWSVPPFGPLSPELAGGVPGTPPSDPIPSRYVPKHFRCPNTIILYVNLYLSTISRLLIMSMISSGTSNNIRSPKHITHIILYRQRTLSMRILRVRKLCRHDRDTSTINNQ